MKRLAALSLLTIMLLAGFTPGHAAAQAPAPTIDPNGELVEPAPAPERPYFARLGNEPPTDITRYGQPWRSVVVYGKYRDPAGLTVDGITIELDSDTIDVDTTTTTNEDGGFYILIQFPAYQCGVVYVRGFAPDGRVTQPGEIYVPERRSP